MVYSNAAYADHRRESGPLKAEARSTFLQDRMDECPTLPDDVQELWKSIADAKVAGASLECDAPPASGVRHDEDALWGLADDEMPVSTTLAEAFIRKKLNISKSGP